MHKVKYPIIIKQIGEEMYFKLPNLVLGFHGCDLETVIEVVNNNENIMKNSENIYDWLGNGIYFWENDYDRALEWAEKSKKYENPAVLGAVIDLGYCLNLSNYKCVFALKKAYDILRYKFELLNKDMPKNRNVKNNKDLLLRYLDCAVIEQLHDINKEMGNEEYDSVRGVFIEGEPIYENSGIFEKTHTQICIRNNNCIKGYFLPRKLDTSLKNP